MAGSEAAADMSIGVYEWPWNGLLSVSPGDVRGQLVEPTPRRIGKGGVRQRVAGDGHEPRDIGLDLFERTGPDEHGLQRFDVGRRQCGVAQMAEQLTISCARPGECERYERRGLSFT